MPKTFDNVNGGLAHHLSVWPTHGLSITLSEAIVSQNLIGIIEHTADLA